MRLWLVRSSDVSLQNQIVTQISLGILTRALVPGERLPSVRELARRFHLHANTVSLAYRRLEHQGFVEVRRGSGVFVRPESTLSGKSLPPTIGEREPAQFLESHIAALLQSASALGIDRAEIRRMMLAATEAPAPGNFVVVEPDLELRLIVVAEMQQALSVEILSTGFPFSPEATDSLTKSILLVLPSKADAVRAALPHGARLHILRMRSIPASLAAFLPAPKTALVAVLSHWPRFLELARTMLIASGFDADALVIRNAGDPHATDNLKVDAVVCDALTAQSVPARLKVIVFRLVADETLDELRAFEFAPASGT